MFKDFIDTMADVAGTTAGIALAPIALALGVTVDAVKRAVDAGCKTQEEIREFLGLDK